MAYCPLYAAQGITTCGLKRREHFPPETSPFTQIYRPQHPKLATSKGPDAVCACALSNANVLYKSLREARRRDKLSMMRGVGPFVPALLLLAALPLQPTSASPSSWFEDRAWAAQTPLSASKLIQDTRTFVRVSFSITCLQVALFQCDQQNRHVHLSFSQTLI